MEEIKKLNNDELEDVSGGANPQDIKFNLSYFGYRTVSVPAGTLLVMQERPRGDFLGTYYVDGESILINMCYSEAGYLFAYKDGVYGYVDMQFVKL